MLTAYIDLHRGNARSATDCPVIAPEDTDFQRHRPGRHMQETRGRLPARRRPSSQEPGQALGEFFS